MRLFYLFFLFIILLVLQGKLRVFGMPLNLTVLVIYFIGIRYGERKGLAAGLFVGFIQDILSGGILGPNLLSKATVGFFSSFFLTGGIFQWTIVFGVIWIALFTAIDGCIIYISKLLFEGTPSPLSFASILILTQSLINAPIGAFIKTRNND